MSIAQHVYVAIYEHRHGTDVAVYRTEESARKWANELARDYWSDFYGDDPMPKENIAEAYFNNMGNIGGDEWFTIEKRDIEA